MIKSLSHKFRKEFNCWRYMGTDQGTYLLSKSTKGDIMEIRSNEPVALKVGTFTKHPRTYA